MLETYNATHEAVRDILTPYNMTEIKQANKAMKKFFGNRLSQVKANGSCQYSYYILCTEGGEWELDSFDWDFFYGTFA